MKSGDGATGVSSTLGAAIGPFAGGAGERMAAAVTVDLDETTDPTDEEGVTVGRPAGDAVETAAAAFPLAPTVVHAPPADEAVGFTLLVVSAYARRGPAVTMDSLDAAFFRLSSSSKMSLMDFFVAGF